MENTTQDVYLDSPSIRRGSLDGSPAPQCKASPATCLQTTTMPHQTEPPAYTNPPWPDSPPASYHDSSSTNLYTPHHPSFQQPVAFHASAHTEYFVPTTPANHPSYSDEEDDENVPLANLFFSRPSEAPPAYSTVVLQSYHHTLLQHVPRHPVVVDIDEEAALEQIRADDVSFRVEQMVAMAVVIALLVPAGLLLGLLLLRN